MGLNRAKMSLITNRVKYQNFAYVCCRYSILSLHNSNHLEAKQMKLLTLTYNHIFCTKTVNIAFFMVFMWKSNLSLVGGFLKRKIKLHAFPVIKYLNERYPRCRTLNSNFCLLSPPSTSNHYILFWYYFCVIRLQLLLCFFEGCVVTGLMKN